MPQPKPRTPIARKKGLTRKGFKKVAFPAPLRCQTPRQGKITDSAISPAGAKLGRKAGLNKRGPRTKAWEKAWRFLKPRLEAAGRTECEFDFIEHGCYGPLDPAHSKKRSKMTGNDIYAVAIACRNIHQVLDEVYTHAAMKKAVMTAIERGGGLILPEVKQ